MSAFLRSLPRPVQGLLGLALFVYPLWQGATVTAPTLITDWAVRDTARPASNALVTNARCTNTNLLLQLCSMAVTVDGAEGRITRQVGYVFVEPHIGPWSYRVLVDPARPYWPTTTLGMDALLDRTLCLGAMLLTCLPLAAGAVLATLGLLPNPPIRLR